MDEVEVVVAHSARATLRVGDVFLKVDADQAHIDIEVEAIALAPVPTPEVLWHQPPVLALAAVPGTALGRLGEPSTASPAAWAAAGAAIRKLHDAPLPPWPSRKSLDRLATEVDGECAQLVATGLLPADLVTRNREVAEAVFRPVTPVFTHGDLQITHVFVDGDEVTGIIDWSDAGRGDPLFDLATGDARPRGAPRRRRRRLRHRGRPRRGPRVVVAAKPAGRALAGGARLRRVRAGLRGRRAQSPDVRPRTRVGVRGLIRTGQFMQGMPLMESGPLPVIVPPFSSLLLVLVVAVEDGSELLLVPLVEVVAEARVPSAIAEPLSTPMTTSTLPDFTESPAVGVTSPSCWAIAAAAASAPLP
jgi:hypothetical protein